MIGSRSISLIMLASLGIPLGIPMIAVPAASAEPSASSVKEAGKHFQRGVSLYTEADYRAALVEFRRAYEIAPNSAVLYNIGETYYQLQNYAAALSTLQRYLNESGTTAAHRREVEQTIDTLQTRVGKVAIVTNVPDCEITVDDELIGRTPLTEPLLVSIGRRKITAMRDGRAPETRFVDVAAGDTVQLALSLGDGAARAPAGALSSSSSTSMPPPPRGSDGRGLITAGWVTTGLLGAGAVTTGVLAVLASRQLSDLRNTYPTSQAELNSKGSRVSTLSAVADILGAAALVTGGLTLTLSLTRSHDHEVHVAVVPNGIQLAGSFR